MYLRMGWVVGNAGLWGAIIIVVVAHIISYSTGLSISSIATDKKVGAGGVYYVLSRSLGLPIGGAIGLTLFVGTALSIALYLVGFGESFNAYLGLSTDINGLRSTGSLFLLLLTILAFISTSVAIKTQFFILTAIVLSLVTIFVGGGSAEINDAVPAFGGASTVPMASVFAVFFPAVTGFTAGIAMSGDLGNPQKDIPAGTIASITVGFVVYIALSFFLSANVDQELLRSDYNILSKISYFGPAVIAGVWGATLSSAIGGILGAPRILQAMSVDRITPKLFGKGVGASNEPRNALLLTVVIAEAGILIGELDLIARIVSMFYLAAYGFINISFFLESWASSDFKPSFKVSRWFGLVGFIATFAVMFKLDILAMVAALVVIGGIFLWLQRKQISLGTGDVWQSVWSTVVKSGLKRLETADDHKRNWKPNIMLFSGNSEARPYLIDFGKSLAGQVGMVTNFDLIENKEAGVLFPKREQDVSDKLLQKFGVFGRRIEVNNIYKGIETIATTFGFSGLDPNTVLMGWGKNTSDPVWFAKMTEKLIALDYNVLYLDYDKRWGFRKREQIDMWWRGISNNAELMLHLARFITAAPDWRNARIRVLLVNDFNVDRRIIENRIQLLLDEFRVQAEIKVISNTVDRKPFYELMKTVSAEADLVFIGIPNIKPSEEASFVSRTNDLVGIIGTTLLVKASSTFEITQLGLKDIEQKQEYEPDEAAAVAPLDVPAEGPLGNAVRTLDEQLGAATEELGKTTLSVLQQHYLQWLSDSEQQALKLFAQAAASGSLPFAELYASLTGLTRLSETFTEEELGVLQRVLEEGITRFRKRREAVLASLPATVRVAHAEKEGKQMKVRLRSSLGKLEALEASPQLKEALNAMGLAHADLILRTAKMIRGQYEALSRQLAAKNEKASLLQSEERLRETFQQLRDQAHAIVEAPLAELRNTDRRICNRLANEAQQAGFRRQLRRERRQLKRKTRKATEAYLQRYSSYWGRNQELLHRNYDASLQLTQVVLWLKERKRQSMQELREDYTDRILQEIQSLQELVKQAKASLEAKDEEAWNALQLYREEADYDNTEAVLWRFMESMKQISSPLPAELTLIDQRSRDLFRQEQGSQLKTINLALEDIASYLIDLQFVSPFQEQLTTLRQQLNRVNGNIYNRASLLGYSLDTSTEKKSTAELLQILHKAEEDLQQMAESVGSIYSTFAVEVEEKYEATEAALRIRRIVDQAGELSQYVRKISRRRGIAAWQERMAQLTAKLQQEWSAFVTRRKEDAAAIAFERKQQQLRSDRDRLRAFVEDINGPLEASQRLPFYYRQLFSGKHLNLGRKTPSRQAEMAEVKKSMAYQREGIRGGIMITGDALSGKSYFVEYAARQLTKGGILRVLPPQGGASAPRALQKAFEQASGKRGNIGELLELLPAGSAVILEDVELWWLRQEEGSRAIELLIDTVQSYSLRYRFLLTANLEALKHLREHTALQRALLSTTVLSPFSQEQMRQVLWARHKTGGVRLSFQGKPEDTLSDKSWDRLFSRLHKQSSGNIGLALHHWLAQIHLAEGDELNWQNEWPAADFPELEDPSWYFVLLQLYLHKALSYRKFGRLFEQEGKAWVEGRISELEKSRILVPHSRDVLELRPAVRYYLGRCLKEKGLL